MRASAANKRNLQTNTLLLSLLALIILLMTAACGDSPSATATPSGGESSRSTQVPTRVQTGGQSSLKGELDPTFDKDGLVTTDLGSTLDTIRGMAAQPDGKIVVVGESWPGRRQQITLARYNPDGNLDASFGETGTVFSKVIDESYDYSSAYAVALQPDGKIVVVGTSASTEVNHSVFAVLRYNADGSFDKTFGAGGKSLTAINESTGYSSSGDEAHAVALQPDGKIVVAGVAGGYPPDFAVARYNADGSLDQTFGDAGVVVTDFNTQDDGANAVAVQPDGKIVVGGYATNKTVGGSDYHDFALVRYNADGTIDKDFGTDGKVLTDMRGEDTQDDGYALALLPNGKIVLGGTAVVGAQFCSTDACWKYGFGLAQYNSDGSLDTSFGDGGTVTRDFTSSAGNYALLRTPDGHLATAGYASYNEFALALYNADGSLDESFAKKGVARFSFGTYGGHGYAIAQQADGKLVVGGTATVDPDDILNGDFALARFR